MKGTVLVVDDDDGMREAVADALSTAGHDVHTAVDGKEGLQRLTEIEPDVVVTDLHMPHLDGVAFVREGHKQRPATAFIVMTAYATVATAVEAIRAGAEQYLTKPIDLEALRTLVDRAMARGEQSRVMAELRAQLAHRRGMTAIIGEHPAMRQVLDRVAKVAPSRANVLITGETGTGKELIAAAIHEHSPRAAHAFVRVNCAALAETLLESELFGHEKGAFTGAVRRRIGRFEQADQGTLFLDEVSEIPLALQVKLLRFLQERQFERVGGEETLTVDVRIVAATNRPLGPRVEDGSFREDLYFRLNVVELAVPPLRAHPSDIRLLVDHFVRRYVRENHSEVHDLSPAAMAALMAYPWPGNVRELENIIERAVVLCPGDTIELEHLGSLATRAQTDPVADLVGLPLAEVERIMIERTLAATGGSTARAAEMLGISQRKIQYKIRVWSHPDDDRTDDRTDE